MTNGRIKEILEQQMELLIKKSQEKMIHVNELCELTQAMVRIADSIACMATLESKETA